MMADSYVEHWHAGTLRCTADGVWIVEDAAGRAVWKSDDEIVAGAFYGRLTIVKALRPHWLVGIGRGVQPVALARCACGRERALHWYGILAGIHRDCGCGIARLAALPQIIDLLDDETLDALIEAAIDDLDKADDR